MDSRNNDDGKRDLYMGGIFIVGICIFMIFFNCMVSYNHIKNRDNNINHHHIHQYNDTIQKH